MWACVCVGGGVPQVRPPVSWCESIIVMSGCVWGSLHVRNVVGPCILNMHVLVRLHVCESGCVPECLLGEAPLSKGVSEGGKRKMTLKGQDNCALLPLLPPFP